MKLCTAALVLAVAITSQARGQSVQIIRDALASTDANGVLLQAEPEHDHLLAPPAIVVDLSDTTTTLAVDGVAMEVQGSAESELELQAIYRGEQPFVFPRRSAADRRIAWKLPEIDQVTSLTLTLRAPSPDDVVRLRAILLADTTRMPLEQQLLANSPVPLFVDRAASPVLDGKLALTLRIPANTAFTLQALGPEWVLRNQSGEEERIAAEIPSPTQAGLRELEIRAAIPVSIATDGSMTVELRVREDGEEKTIARTDFDPRPADFAYLEIPRRSVEDLAVLERNGEMAIYTTVGPEGLRQGPSGAPLVADAVWLSVGNGREWPVNEVLLRGRRDVVWLGGGPVSLGIGTIGNFTYGVYSTGFTTGLEALSIASGHNSLRLSPAAQNPIYPPGLHKGIMPAPMLVRGNVFFGLNGAKVVITLIRKADEPTTPRLLVADMLARWLDLGDMPLPGYNPANLQLSGLQDGDNYFLLAGPEPQLWRSTSPIRDWQPVDLEAPEGWTHLQLVRWEGRLWLFGIVRANGRGIVRWAPVSVHQDRYTVDPHAKFDPPPLRSSLE